MERKVKTKLATVEEYFSAQPPAKRALLRDLRSCIRKNAPGAEEVISYSMPAFKKLGMLVWYAAFKDHIGFYPGARAIERFEKELSGFTFSKGAIQFPISKPLPLRLVGKIVNYRVKENEEKAAKKTKA